MHLNFRNVNTAFHELVKGIHTGSITTSKKSTRNGFVFQVDEPMLITYSHPKERVLFNQERDANPFFMLYEALWMLAGRNDVGSVAYYAKQMREYSDDGKTLNGAYGHRWRNAKSTENGSSEGVQGDIVHTNDQIQIIIDHLRADPNSRRAVLQMWNVEDDLLKIGPDREDCQIKVTSKDVCCNLSVMFSLRNGVKDTTTEANKVWVTKEPTKFLDMTVTNRSNDMIWGMLGANYVHFTFLQEYIAGCLGVEVGKYHHFTNNLHVYDWNWKPEEWLAESTAFDDFKGPMDGFHVGNGDDWVAWYNASNRVPLVKSPVVFEQEVKEVVNWYNGTRDVDTLTYKGPREHGWRESFLEEVAGRVFAAFAIYKVKDRHGALAVLADCPADDWRIACTNWIKRRLKNG